MARIGTALALCGALPLVMSLGGCGGLVAAGSALGAASSVLTIANTVAAGADAVVKDACVAYDTGKAATDAVVKTGLVPGEAEAKITSIESFGDAACADPPSGDALSTAIWLGQLVGQIATLADQRQG
ncbi:MAG TPA: hypothetical protein VGG57_02320 [Stellaceae bacterium]|jgi:hypothetical protein